MRYVTKLSPHIEEDGDADIPIAADTVRTLRLVTDAHERDVLAADGVNKMTAISGNRWRRALARADDLELHSVRRLAATTRFRPIRSATLFVNFLGNGWIYPPIVLGLLLSNMSTTWAIIGTAILATAIAHALYAMIKRRIARPRPFERDPNLHPLARALDRYSFPSGHCMTLTTVLAPIVHSVPDFRPVAIAALCILAWCRLAAAHHYPSDTLAGVCIGAAIATPLTLWLVPL